MTKEDYYLDNGNIGDLKTDFRDLGLGDDLTKAFFSQMPQTQYIKYELTVDKTQVFKDLHIDLERNGKKLRVTIPARVKNGTRIRLRNARQVTDGIPGDIYVKVNIVKSSKRTASDSIGFHLWDRFEQFFKKGK